MPGVSRRLWITAEAPKTAYYEDLSDDVYDENDIRVTSAVLSSDLAMLTSEYEEKLEIFVRNEETVTVDVILAFIGEKKTIE